MTKAENTAFLFPGQGSQHVGMGQDLFRKDEHFQRLVTLASDLTGEDLKRLCLRGPERKLISSRYTQPLLVAVSLGYLKHLADAGVRVDVVLGHSLGEVSALAAAGAIPSERAIEIAVKRGELMDETAAETAGGMWAILSLSSDCIEDQIERLDLIDRVVVANYNSADQIVISGDVEGCKSLCAALTDTGGRCKRLNVAGPWHSPYLRPAYERFQLWAKDIVYTEPHTPLILNSSAAVETDPAALKQSVEGQLCSPVYFQQCLGRCRELGITRFLEVGPSRVLAGLVRANGFGLETRVHTVNDLRGVASAVSEIMTA